MKTEKLYELNPFLTEFTATVLSCEAEKNGFLAVLDRTAFYPEGGGQPADHGTLNGIAVTDVHETNGVVFHNLEKKVEIGQTITGRIDWSRRFDHMQQHSGEHICSGLICSRYNCSNVGFHMGEDLVTIDYDADIPWEELLQIEEQANQYIWEDHAVSIKVYRNTELDSIAYRSKKKLEGDVRIVAFPGADCCACCGTHVLRSGQVGLVKFLSVQKFRSGVRIGLLCGNRAYQYLSRTWEQARRIGQHLSVKPEMTANAVFHLQTALTSAQARMNQLEESAFAARAQQLAGAGNVLLLEDGLTPDGARRLSDAVAQRCGGLAAVFSPTPERDGYLYALVRADGADIAPFVRKLNSVLSGRGGGRKGFAQGSVHSLWPEIQKFMEEEAQCHAQLGSLPASH